MPLQCFHDSVTIITYILNNNNNNNHNNNNITHLISSDFISSELSGNEYAVCCKAIQFATAVTNQNKIGCILLSDWLQTHSQCKLGLSTVKLLIVTNN